MDNGWQTPLAYNRADWVGLTIVGAYCTVEYSTGSMGHDVENLWYA